MKICSKHVGCRFKGLFKELFEKALYITGNKVDNLVVGVSFVGGDEIQVLNKEHRNVDKVTDVLSFPMLDIDYKKTKLKDFESERDPNGELYIGDIVICKDKAKEQAKEFGHSYKREMAFLALHGFLHVLGYDHIEKADEEVMMNLAENVLLNMNIKRGKNV